tara:strand:- start:684 stop:1010 length:327 start_codon:yes stop_codon:yes gene_type:complete
MNITKTLANCWPAKIYLFLFVLNVIMMITHKEQFNNNMTITHILWQLFIFTLLLYLCNKNKHNWAWFVLLFPFLFLLFIIVIIFLSPGICKELMVKIIEEERERMENK